MQYFYIKQGAVLPSIRLELIYDGRYDFMKSYQFSNAIQNADVTFTMRDDQGHLIISKQPCSIVLVDDGTCEERYIIEYKWKKRDTKIVGEFNGTIEITFNSDENGNSDLYESGVTYPSGNLIAPIWEDLRISIKP